MGDVRQALRFTPAFPSTWGASALVSRTTRVWFEKDVQLPARHTAARTGSTASACIPGQSEMKPVLRLLPACTPQPRTVRGRRTGGMREEGRKASMDGTPLPSLGELLEFMRLLWALDHGLRTRSKRMAATLGTTGPQRLVVRIVGRFPGLSAKQLAQVLHLHPSTLTGILRRLERTRVLTRRRDPRDGRRSVLRLSAAGRRLDVMTAGTIESVMRRVLAKLPRHKVRSTREVLNALARGLSEDPRR